MPKYCIVVARGTCSRHSRRPERIERITRVINRWLVRGLTHVRDGGAGLLKERLAYFAAWFKLVPDAAHAQMSFPGLPSLQSFCLLELVNDLAKGNRIFVDFRTFGHTLTSLSLCDFLCHHIGGSTV